MRVNTGTTKDIKSVKSKVLTPTTPHQSFMSLSKNMMVPTNKTVSLTSKQWNDLIDTHFVTSKIELDDLDLLNDYQRYFLNEVKKSMARLKNKQ